VVPPERLVFTWGHADETDHDSQSVVTVVFADVGDKTEMTFRQTGLSDDEIRQGVEEGWTSCIEKLTEYTARPTPAL